MATQKPSNQRLHEVQQVLTTYVPRLPGTDANLLTALCKAVVFGAIVGVISCHKGLATSGGPAGVANSVNAAVVETILLLMIVNVSMSQLYLLLFPKTSL